MTKYLITFSILGLLSCSTDPWSRDEKNEFKNDCLDSGASNSYCNCYQENAMKQYPNYNELRDISFEEAVELSLGCE